MGAQPPSPASKRLQVVAISPPSGVTPPSPVTTTRRSNSVTSRRPHSDCTPLLLLLLRLPLFLQRLLSRLLLVDLLRVLVLRRHRDLLVAEHCPEAELGCGLSDRRPRESFDVCVARPTTTASARLCSSSRGRARRPARRSGRGRRRS